VSRIIRQRHAGAGPWRLAALLHDTIKYTQTTYDELRGMNASLERVFDQLYRQRPTE
jgi:hypothetical protein